MESKEVAQEIRDWGSSVGEAMKQEGSGSMDYMEKKEKIRKEDDRKISKQILPQK